MFFPVRYLNAVVILLWLFSCAPQEGSAFSRLFGEAPSESIRATIEEIQAELSGLPSTKPVQLPWSTGFQSKAFHDAENEVSYRIDFKEAFEIDLIVLVPAIMESRGGEYQSLGFPRRFSITGIRENGSTELLVDFAGQDYPLEGIEPQLFHLDTPLEFTGIQIVVHSLSSSLAWSEPVFRMALSEVMVFADNQNVALRTYPSSPSTAQLGGGWSGGGLVDGFFTFSPVDRDHISRDTSFVARGKGVELIFDLGEKHTVDAFRIWPVVHEFHHDYARFNASGFPTDIYLEVLTDSSDGEGRFMWQTDPSKLAYPGSNPFERSVMKGHNWNGRYFRMTLQKPAHQGRTEFNTVSFTEIELLSKGICVSTGSIKAVRVLESNGADSQKAAEEKINRITDSVTDGGTILPLRAFIEGINRRFVLEREMMEQQEKLLLSVQREKGSYWITMVSLVGLCSILGLSMWVSRLQSRQKLLQIREQIACDLHDQIGANLSSIAITNQLLERSMESPSEMQKQLLAKSISKARRTADDASQIVRFLEGRVSGDLLTNQIRQAASELLHEIEVRCDLKEKESINNLDTARKWDLLLFVKEAFNNIIKHSGASSVQVLSRKEGKRTIVEVVDDGCGMEDPSDSLVHLEKRARRLGGQLSIRTQKGQGTKITLSYL